MVAGLCRALMGDALDDPEPFAPRQAHAAGQHAKPRSKQGVRLCSDPGGHHNAELDVSRLADDMIFNDLQPRMVCTV
jgi:hypothetical protein